MLKFGRDYVNQPCVTQDDIDSYKVTSINKFKYFDISQFLHVPYCIVFTLNNLFQEKARQQQDMQTLLNRFTKLEETVKKAISLTKGFDQRIQSQQLQILGVRNDFKSIEENETFLTQQKSSNSNYQQIDKKQEKIVQGKLTLSNLQKVEKAQNGEILSADKNSDDQSETEKNQKFNSQQFIQGLDPEFNFIQQIKQNEEEISNLKEQIKQIKCDNQLEIQQVIDQNSQNLAKIFTKLNNLQDKIPEHYKKDQGLLKQEIQKIKSDSIDLSNDFKEFKKNNLKNIHTLVDSARGKMLQQVKEIYKDIFDEINKKLYTINKETKENKTEIDKLIEYNIQQDKKFKNSLQQQQEEIESKILKVKYDLKDLKDSLQQNINENQQDLLIQIQELDKNQSDQKAMLFKHNGQLQKLFTLNLEMKAQRGNIESQTIDQMFGSEIDEKENEPQKEENPIPNQENIQIEKTQLKINNKYYNKLDPIQRKIQNQLKLQNKPTNYRDQYINLSISTKSHSINPNINNQQIQSQQNRNKFNYSNRISQKRNQNSQSNNFGNLTNKDIQIEFNNNKNKTPKQQSIQQQQQQFNSKRRRSQSQNELQIPQINNLTFQKVESSNY